MKLQVVAVCLVALGILQGSAAAQDWSTWTSSNHDVQYRWLASAPGESATCHLQLRDTQRKSETIVSVRIDYKYDNKDESTREIVTITNLSSDGLGERTVFHCASIGDVHVTDIVRR
jgi:hypothetical protein